MAGTAVSTASLPLTRRASPTAAAHGPRTPSLRKRYCAARPVASSSNPTLQPTANEESSGRRQVLVAGAAAAAALLSRPNPAAYLSPAENYPEWDEGHAGTEEAVGDEGVDYED